MDRRAFLGKAIGAAGVAAAASSCAWVPLGKAGTPKPTDRIELGNTGIKLTRVAMGSGTVGGRKQSNQTRLGQEAFTKIARHALDSGLNFFDSADSYGSMPYFRKALEGVPRDRIVLLSKIGGDSGEKAQKDLERFLGELGTDYIDIVLTHCATTDDWTKRREGVLEALSNAKEKGMIRAHGLSWHGMAPLQTVAGCGWGDLALVRINHNGAKMDGSPDEVVPHIRRIKQSGKFVMGMKIVGEGTIADELDQSLRFTLGLNCLDAMTIGFEKPEQIDDLLRRWESAMNGAAVAAAA